MKQAFRVRARIAEPMRSRTLQRLSGEFVGHLGAYLRRDLGPTLPATSVALAAPMQMGLGVLVEANLRGQLDPGHQPLQLAMFVELAAPACESMRVGDQKQAIFGVAASTRR